MSDHTSGTEGFGDPGNLNDPTACVEEMLERAIAEPFGRHMKALERRYGVECQLGLVRINLILDPDERPGLAALVITEMFPDVDLGDPPPVEAYIVAGVNGLGMNGVSSYAPTWGQVERAHALAVRLAIAHELGHLALMHTIVDGRLKVPDAGFTRDQDWEASAYAVYLTRLTSLYLSQHRALLVPYKQSVQEWVTANWHNYARRGIRLAFEGYLQQRPAPWPTMTPEEINDFRMGK